MAPSVGGWNFSSFIDPVVELAKTAFDYSGLDGGFGTDKGTGSIFGAVGGLTGLYDNKNGKGFSGGFLGGMTDGQYKMMGDGLSAGLGYFSAKDAEKGAQKRFDQNMGLQKDYFAHQLAREEKDDDELDEANNNMYAGFTKGMGNKNSDYRKPDAIV